MSPSEHGWAEYKQLFLADRAANLTFQREAREFFDRVDRRMTGLETRLTTIETQRSAGKWFMGVVAAAVSAVVGTGIAVAGVVWK